MRSAMKVRLGWLADPTLHVLAAVVAVVVGMQVLVGRGRPQVAPVITPRLVSPAEAARVRLVHQSAARAARRHLRLSVGGSSARPHAHRAAAVVDGALAPWGG